MTKTQIETKLETLRSDETTKRAALVDALEHLANRALRAAHKISTREWEDGLACIDSEIDDFRSFQDDLESAVQEIEWAEWQLMNDCDEEWCSTCDRPQDDCACVEHGGTY